MARLNLIARSNGVGLDQDVDLIRKAALAGEHEVTFSHCRSLSPFARWLPSRPKYDANLFLERIFPRWLKAAKTNILIPNQERFPTRHLGRLRHIDHVFCKSRHALEIFKTHHPSCHYIGFTSCDLNRPEVPRAPDGVLHLAGRSTLKGTETILALWRRHPDWPTLTLLQHLDNAPSEVPDNVNLITDYLSREHLITLINRNPIHLCPSRSEGWGHYIVEAMSCGAVVITTDAPPMNELVQEDRGLLVSVADREPRHLGTNFHVAPDSLEEAIDRALEMTSGQKDSIADSARDWFAQNDRQFQSRLTELLRALLSPPQF